MSSFIQQIADYLKNKYNGEYENIAVILPSQRAKHFLTNELSKNIEKPIFLPNLFTISDFIGSLSPYQNISTGELLIDLYKIYSSHDNLYDDDFAKFVSWGTMFLQDINDIDMQMKNAGDIFTNLANIKELDITLFKETSEKSAKRQKYLDFYYSLKEIYTQLHKTLEEQRHGYAGMLYRDVAENIAAYSGKLNFQTYIFAGFNAFTPAEATIVRHYLENKNAKIFFDLDTFYFDTHIPDTLPPYSRNISDLIHLTMKRLNLTEGDIKFIGNHYKETAEKQITVTGISKGFNQVQYAIGQLKKFENELDKTAVIFADEALIVPFINAYDCTKANLTMGYPIQGLPAYNLLQVAIQLVKNGKRMSVHEPAFKFYHKDILAFLRHPIIRKKLFTSDKYHEKFVNVFISLNQIMIPTDTLAELINGADETEPIFREKTCKFLSQISEDGLAPVKAIFHLFDFLAENAQTQNRQEAALYRLICNNLSDVENLLGKFPENVEFNIDTIEFFINSQFNGITLTLSGSRDKGLQVMGILETRALDFDNIILLSANEGNLPVGKSQNSLILYEVRKHFGLPTYHEKEAVSAYHFFRLLQRAKNIQLIYDNDTNDSLSEKSRFINQLKFENMRQKTGFKFIEQNISQQPSLKSSSQELSIEKNNATIDRLLKMHYSPTRLTTYITCPLKFYLKHIAKIEPPQNISEDIDSSVIGTVVHAIFEHIFTELKKMSEKKNELTESEISTVFDTTVQNLETLLKKAFVDALDDKKIKSVNLTRGKSFLTKNICKNNIEAYLPIFKSECSLIKEYINAERNYSATIRVNSQDITLQGYIDRVEKRIDGNIYILDYKTGKTDEQILKKFEIEDVTTNEEYKQPLQLLTYAYLFANGDQQTQQPLAPPPYKCGIISLQNVAAKKDSTCAFEVTQDLLDKFTQRLTTLFEEILNPEIQFTQTEETKYCAWCDYNDICGRASAE